LPTIEFDYEDFKTLLGVEITKDPEKLDELFSYVKGEVKLIQADEVTAELQDTNRPDLWSVEGLARALQGFIASDKGLKRYVVEGGSGVEVWVGSGLKDIRPYIACAVVKGVNLTYSAIRQLMHLQDKMDQTYGRQRRRTSIGLYDFDLVSPPLRYGVAEPDEVSFVPLDFEEELTLGEILKRHPKGIEFGHLVRPYPVWPVFMDSKHKVLSFPPIINSNDLGRVTECTTNVLIEVTGTAYKSVLNTLTNVTLALADRGGSIYSAEIHYPYEDVRNVVTPELRVETLSLDVDYVRKVTGIELNISEIRGLLERSRYGVIDATEFEVTVEIPCYRVDIMHPIDVVEDITIAYNYNKMKPIWPKLFTIGDISFESKFRDLVREIMVGLGFQEILSFTLSNPDILFARMNLRPEKVVEIANPKVVSLTCLRNWLLPSLMEFLSHNIHVEYPQRVFEVGYCIVHDATIENKTRDLEKLACVTIHSNANFTETKSMLDSFLVNLGLHYELEETSHGSFIEGRIGKVLVGNSEIGLIGEIHPKVLQNWHLENPAAAFEITLNKLREFL